MLGAWGQKKTIAQRMAEAPAAATPTPSLAAVSLATPVVEEKKKPVVVHEATNCASVAASEWYVPHGDDGATRAPDVIALAGNLTVAIAVIVLVDGRVLMQRSDEPAFDDGTGYEDDEKHDEKKDSTVWAIPTGTLDSVETLPHAARRIMKEECGVDFDAHGVAAVEHYPSLQRNWFRFAFTGSIGSGALPGHMSWLPASAVLDEQVALSNPDFLPALKSAVAGRVIPLPMSRESIGFAHLLAETALFYNNRVLLVKADGRRELKSGSRPAGSTAAAAPVTSSAAAAAAAAPPSSGGLFAFRGAMHSSEMPELKPQVTKPEPTPSTSEPTLVAATPAAAAAAAVAAPSTSSSVPSSVPAPTTTLPITAAAPLPVSDSALAGGRVGGSWWWTLPCTHIDRGETAGFAAVRLMRALYGWTIDTGAIAAIEHSGRSDLICDGIRITVMARADTLAVDGSYTRAVSAPAPDYRWATLEQLQQAAKDGSIRADLLTSLTPLFATGDVGVPLLQVGA